MQLIHGDCLEKMKDIPDKSVDMILCDLPYGSLECNWDNVIPFEPLWEQYKRIIKEGSAIVLFGQELFVARLMLSNIDMYRYSLVWQKSKSTRYAQAKLRFLKEHEDIVVFSSGKCSANSIIKMKYYPQGLLPYNKIVRDSTYKCSNRAGRKQLPDYIQEYTNYPKTILTFPSEGRPQHPTQKPVALLEYLIKTYTLENETVLDNCMGSGSTGVACLNTKRDFIGIEKDDKYIEIAKKRIEEHLTTAST